jgi:hypothetical protein
MNKLTVTVGTKLRIKTNTAIGICTVTKIDYLVDEFGDKTTVQAAKYVNEHGVAVGCTRLDQLTDVHFEVVG